MSITSDFKKEIMEAAHNDRIKLALSRAIASYRSNTNNCSEEISSYYQVG